MGTVIRFPFERRDIWSDVYHEEPALVLILPVIAINREAGLISDRSRERCQQAFEELRIALWPEIAPAEL